MKHICAAYGCREMINLNWCQLFLHKLKNFISGLGFQQCILCDKHKDV